MTRAGSRGIIGPALGSLALIAALAPAPQSPDATPREPKALAAAKATVCRRMIDYYLETLKAPPLPGELPGPAARYSSGYEPIELWSRRLADARLDATSDPTERVAILRGEVDRIGKFSGEIAEMAKESPEWKIVADRVEYYRLDAEYRLATEKAGK